MQKSYGDGKVRRCGGRLQERPVTILSHWPTVKLASEISHNGLSVIHLKNSDVAENWSELSLWFHCHNSNCDRRNPWPHCLMISTSDSLNIQEYSVSKSNFENWITCVDPEMVKLSLIIGCTGKYVGNSRDLLKAENCSLTSNGWREKNECRHQNLKCEKVLTCLCWLCR